MSAKKKKKKNRSHPIRRFFLTVLMLALTALIVWVLFLAEEPLIKFADIFGENEPVSVATQQPEMTATPEITPAPTPVPTPAPTPVILDHPYYLVVDRGANVVTAYTVAQDGTYTLPAREMICATDQMGQYPPDGLYALDGAKMRWYAQVSYEDTYFQYTTRITDKIMFTSLPYTAQSADQLNVDAYYLLGENATTGNVWLLCEDAKWIYDNVDAGTPVMFVSGGVRDAGVYAPDLGDTTWDPTDDDPFNMDYNEAYAKPAATPWLGVTPMPTADWNPDKLN